jgi:hypothetical protein
MLRSFLFSVGDSELRRSSATDNVHNAALRHNAAMAFQHDETAFYGNEILLYVKSRSSVSK